MGNFVDIAIATERLLSRLCTPGEAQVVVPRQTFIKRHAVLQTKEPDCSRRSRYRLRFSNRRHPDAHTVLQRQILAGGEIQRLGV